MQTLTASEVHASLDPAAINQLARNFSGEMICPGDADYEQARKAWNGVIDKHPALILRPHHTGDVVTAVNFAREHKLVPAVRGGGHNVAGHGTNDNGLVIDLSLMKRIEVDPVNSVARAQGGVLWGELDAATQAYGLATPGGVYSKTGIAGLTLGGGFGWLRNKHGLSSDNLIGAEVVTADGEVVHASESENADLLWGLRGGGGNFGVVTTFEYKLHPVGPEVMFAFALHDGTDANEMKRALHFYRDFHANAPKEVSTLLALGKVPPVDHFPAELHNKPFILMSGLYAGPVAEGERLLQPLRDFSAPLLDISGVMPYVQAQQAFDQEFPDGMRYYWKSLNLNRFGDEAIDLIVEHARRQPSPLSTTDIWQIGGAVTETNPNSTAFYGRQSSFLLNAEANWVDPQHDEANIKWVRDFVGAAAPFSDGSRYLNFAGFQEEGDKMMQSAYGTHYEQMAELKRKYDPNNLFRLNQNVKPNGA